MRFVKMHGLGNDFVVVDGRKEQLPEDLSELSRRVCDRHFGVGADGLVFIMPSDKADVRMRIFNPDGSEAEMCGNAIRCVAKYLYEKNIIPKEKIEIETLAGVMVPEIIKKNGEITGVRVDMGEPVLEPRQIPMEDKGPGPVVGRILSVKGREFSITAVSMGNPHCVIFVPEVDKVPLKEWGPELETHPVFPRRTNVEFVEVLNRREVRMRVWERGAGETLACGTGACATVVASVLNDRTDREVTVHLQGGDLQIYWSPEDNRVYMTGPAVDVFEGRLLI
ncbi:diaminopimelate epimerase [Calderihabitans maritimus]|uniref:Diaminopimelate epimerase n=1 Tax=Calderihabitans maritimus TaxID=1246530 RepID=A0A1Z5HX59_9FIRM|nr:diaminopimelate epimerase [Calderihabitans maritimus]GAW93947.1 diaminopimelate epimerase [Calderihabitans maritimus]